MTKEGLMPIYLRVTIGGKRFETSTHRYVLTSKWSVEANRVKGNSNEARSINVFLDSLLNKVYVYHQELINEAKAITIENFINKWSGKKEKLVMLFEIFEQHNQKITGLIGNGYAPATLTKYRTTLDYCRQFVEFRYNQKDIGLASLDYEFISEFEFWLKSKKKCAHNTTMKYLINFKKVVLIGVKNEWIQKDPFSSYKMSRENVTRHALTEKELFTIAGRDFKNVRLNQVRDIFVFCCYTGLAYVDVNKLCRRDIIDGYCGEKWLVISRQKTDSQSRIPLLPAALEILTRYADHPECSAKSLLLPVLSNQKMNAYLKEIGDLCLIEKPITFHLARHTFATTVTLTNGVPIESVSKMLGHNSIKTTQIYAKIVDRKISEDMNLLK